MKNDTAGLFGGLCLAAAIAGTAFWLSPSARAWAIAKLGGASSTSTSSSAGTPATGNSSFGTFNSTVSPSSSSPYQLALGPNGVGIQTAAIIPANEAAMISLPSIPSLAPTAPTLQYA